MDNEMRIRVLLSAQTVLLGAIGKNVLKVFINIPQPGENLKMTVYYEDSLSEDEIDALKHASVEILAQIYPTVPDDEVEFIKWDTDLIPPGEGVPVFMRYGIGTDWGVVKLD